MRSLNQVAKGENYIIEPKCNSSELCTLLYLKKNEEFIFHPAPNNATS